MKKERDLIEMSKKERFVGVIRVDLFYGKIPKVIEINADFPDGFFMHDITSREIMSLVNRKKFISFNHANLFHKLLLSEKIHQNDHIFIGYDKVRKFVDEFILTKQQLENLGWKNISVGAFEDLEYRNSTFYFDGKKVQVIRRGAELFKLRRIPGFINKLVKAQKNDLKVINNFKMRLVGHKSLMAALHDSRFHKYLTKREIEAVNVLLPKTIKLDKCDVNSIIKEKDLWVLKPTDRAEGEGVSVGNSLTQSEWENSLSMALGKSEYWILQQKVTIPESKFTLIDQVNMKISSSVKKYDFDPHVVVFRNHSETGSILVRFSDSEILNVMKGGGLTYAFVEKK